MIYEQQKLRIHQALFVLCILFTLFSPKNTLEEVQAKSTHEATGNLASGMAEKVQTWRKTIESTGWMVETFDRRPVQKDCNVECKINTLTWIGIDEKLARPLVENCKRFALNPRHCIIAWASIMTAESGWKLENCNHKNCMGLGWWWFWYDTYEAGVIDWITRYSRFWYKAKSATFFYPAKGEKSKSRYCTSELSSGSEVWCPFGLSHASSTWKKLDSIF